MSSSLWWSSNCELPFTNQVWLWIARLLILAQAFTNSAACVGHSHSIALHGHTHTYTSKPEFAATEAPTHSNCSAYVVSCMTARSIKGLLNLFFQAVWDFHTTVTGMWGTFVVVIIFIHLKTMEKGKKEGGFPFHAYKSRWTGTVVVLPMGHALNFL